MSCYMEDNGFWVDYLGNIAICRQNGTRNIFDGTIFSHDVRNKCSMCNDVCEGRYTSNDYDKSYIYSMTGKCNLRCEMCFFSEKLNNIGSNRSVSNEFIKIINSNTNKIKIKLEGGEPFTEPSELIYIIDKIRSKNIYLRIFTNGTILNYDVIKELYGFEKIDLIFSIDGDHLYNKNIRGSDFNDILKNMCLVDEYKKHNNMEFNICTSTTISSLNVHNLNSLFSKLSKYGNIISDYGMTILTEPINLISDNKILLLELMLIKICDIDIRILDKIDSLISDILEGRYGY